MINCGSVRRTSRLTYGCRPISPAADAVTTYIIEAGSAPGANNQGTFVAPSTSRLFEREAAAGTYYVRMFARNACGTSPASQEVTIAIK